MPTEYPALLSLVIVKTKIAVSFQNGFFFFFHKLIYSEQDGSGAWAVPPGGIRDGVTGREKTGLDPGEDVSLQLEGCAAKILEEGLFWNLGLPCGKRGAFGEYIAGYLHDTSTSSLWGLLQFLEIF